MAVGWNTNAVSTALTLTSSYQTVQNPGNSADWEIALDPNQVASILVLFDPQASPTDDLEIVFPKSLDGGTDWESDGVAFGFQVSRTVDPNKAGCSLSGSEYREFRIRAKQTGATDTTNSVTVEVSIATLS